MPLVDLSHTITDGLETYPGLPAPVVCDFLTRDASRAHYADDTSFHIGRIDMVANTGTYVDAPFHRFENGADVAELSLAKLAHLPAHVVRARDLVQAGVRALDAEIFRDVAHDSTAVLVDTGWSERFGTPAYFEPHPYLTKAAAQLLAEANVAFVGIDSLNIDDTTDGRRPVHTTLLGAGIPIGEHLSHLDACPDSGARFHAVPVKVRGMGTFPVRAYAVLKPASLLP